jgi:hypothetical protein
MRAPRYGAKRIFGLVTGWALTMAEQFLSSPGTGTKWYTTLKTSSSDITADTAIHAKKGHL